MSKVKSSRMTKKERERKENRKGMMRWIILTLGYAIFLMWVSGMTQAYFPDLMTPGGGQYFDLQIGFIIVGTSVYFVLSGWLLKNSSKW